MTPAVQHLPQNHRFEVHVDGAAGELVYRTHGGVMTIVHTEVAAALGGRGIAGALVEAALDHARAEGLKVDPACSYAKAYMERHPESRTLHV